VLDDGDVLTAAGVSSGIDLALHLAERHMGSEVADRVAELLDVDAVAARRRMSVGDGEDARPAVRVGPTTRSGWASGSTPPSARPCATSWSKY
jgi:hypothetical protein